MASILGGFYCSRNTLVALNIFYIIVSFILIGTATYAKANAFIVDYKILGGIIACGVILLAIALIGLLGTGLHHQVMLFVYMIALILLFVIQFSVACVCLALNADQQQTLFVMGWNRSSLETKYALQTTSDCCGATSGSQNVIVTLENQTGIGHPPCINTTTGCSNSTEICCTGESTTTNVTAACHRMPCWDAWKDNQKKIIRAVGTVGLFFSFTELVGTWLAYRYRNLKDPNVNPNAFL